MNPAQEVEWLEKARQDPQAFTHLYNHYFPKLYTYVSYRVGRLQDTEDIVAETFLRVIRDLKAFKGRYESSFAAWLFRIAHNLITDRYRQTDKTINQPLDELAEVPADSGQPEEIAMQKEDFLQLYHLIEKLPARRQEVITLKFFGGLRNQEIAQVLGLGERTVASHLCRGLEDLHQMYQDELHQTDTGDPNQEVQRGRR
jgi:RNA polymerase sigma factor (sigma-70 family)